MFDIINHKLLKMKNALFYSIVLLFVCNVNAQKSSGTIKDSDKLTLSTYKILEEYQAQNFDYWNEIYSDNAKIYYNNMRMDKKTFIEVAKQDFVLFNGIEIPEPNEEGNYAHTNYFTSGVNKGDVWTNHWFEWSGTGNKSGIRYSVRAHVDSKWENDKIIEQLFYADPNSHRTESSM